MVNVKPFFILSNPRSGSSLLRVICESNSHITVAPESGFIEWWFNKYGDWRRADNMTSRFQDYCRDLLSSRKFETWNFDLDLFKKLVKQQEPEDYAELSALVHICHGLQRKGNLRAWGDKNNYYIHKTFLLNKLFPKAKFLFIIRDGRDVATSYRSIKKIKTNSPYIPNLPVNICEIASEWTENNLIVSSFLKSIEDKRAFVIRYEDLVLDLEVQCRNICKFLDIPFDKRMLVYFRINKELNLEPKETLDWKKKTLKSPDRLAIGKYKEELTPQELEIFNEIASEALKKFRYEI